MSEVVYKIRGIQRRALKKEASKCRQFLEDFWHFHQIEKDLGTCRITDAEAKFVFWKHEKELAMMEEMLKETGGS